MCHNCLKIALQVYINRDIFHVDGITWEHKTFFYCEETGYSYLKMQKTNIYHFWDDYRINIVHWSIKLHKWKYQKHTKNSKFKFLNEIRLKSNFVILSMVCSEIHGCVTALAENKFNKEKLNHEIWTIITNIHKWYAVTHRLGPLGQSWRVCCWSLPVRFLLDMNSLLF